MYGLSNFASSSAETAQLPHHNGRGGALEVVLLVVESSPSQELGTSLERDLLERRGVVPHSDTEIIETCN